MNKPKIFIGENIPEEVLSYLSQFCYWEKWEGKGMIPRNELLGRIKDVDGLMLFGIKIDEELLNHAPKLKVVSNISVGYNNFDLKVMKERNIIGTNTPGVLDSTVADLIFGLILSSARRISELDKYVKEGHWKRGDDESIFGIDVHHKTLGIIGMGRIGEAVAKRARFGFDMEVCYYNRSRKIQAEETLGINFSEFEPLLRKSDFILIMTPLTDATYHIIGHKEFNMMKNSAVFINASRGQTVDEVALIEALKNKRIFGAALDVYEKEPIDPENPLLKMSNVVTVPHIGSATHKTRYDMAMHAAINLVSALQGKIQESIVPELLK